GEDAPAEQEAVIRGAALSLSVVVRAANPWQKTEAVEWQELVGGGIGDPPRKPKDPSRNPSGADDAGVPRFAEEGQQSPFARERQHTARVAAADVNDILAEQTRSQVCRRAPEEQQVRRAARQPGKGRVEAHERRVRVSVRGGDETDRGVRGACLAQNIAFKC